MTATFAADDLAAGKHTAKTRGCAVRMYIADERLQDGLDVSYEILGGTDEDRRAIVEESERIFAARFKVTQDRPAVWRAQAVFEDLQPLLQHPLYGILLHHRESADRMMIVFEDGTAILRVDVSEDAAEAVAAAFKDAMARSGLDGMVRIADLGRSLEDWQPLA